MESISEPWYEDDCEAVEGVTAGPEEPSQGNNGLLRVVLSVVKAERTDVSEISDIKSKASEIEKSVEDLLSYSRTICAMFWSVPNERCGVARVVTSF
jgi:hypothetical protein